MADHFEITAGSGTKIHTDEGGVSGGHMQTVKLAVSADGVETFIPATVANGLLVDVSRVAGNVTVIQGTATNLKVDASDNAVPVTDDGGSLTVDAPVATPAFVRLSDGSNPIATLPVSLPGGVVVNSGAITVSGTATVTQGAAGGADWPVVESVSLPGIKTAVELIDNMIATAAAASPANGAMLAGDESGTARLVKVDAGGRLVITPVAASGSAYADANPLPVRNVAADKTPISKEVALTASLSDQTLWTPAGGNKFLVETMILTISTSGALEVFDNTDAAGNYLYKGTPPVGVFVITFPNGKVSQAADNLLRWTTGANIVGDLVVHGYEIT